MRIGFTRNIENPNEEDAKMDGWMEKEYLRKKNKIETNR